MTIHVEIAIDNDRQNSEVFEIPEPIYVDGDVNPEMQKLLDFLTNEAGQEVAAAVLAAIVEAASSRQHHIFSLDYLIEGGEPGNVPDGRDIPGSLTVYITPD